MTNSSGNSPGQSSSCPACAAKVAVDPEITVGDIECPGCGRDLWYFQIQESPVFFDRATSSEKRQFAIEYLSEKLKVEPDQVFNNPDLMYHAALDSLGIVELVMDLEEKLTR